MDVWCVMDTIHLVGHLLSVVTLLVVRNTLADEHVLTLSPKLLAQVRYWTKFISNYNMHRVVQTSPDYAYIYMFYWDIEAVDSFLFMLIN